MSYDLFSKEMKVIAEFKGLRVIADLERMCDTERGAAIEAVERLLTRLRQEPGASRGGG